jgi:hypothetical protein
MGMSVPQHRIVYRLWQVRQQFGFVAPLSAEERAEVARWLPDSAVALFETMSAADQRHALRVCRGLQERGCTEKELLAAALLHDVGKAGVPFWTRPAIVISKRCFPRLLARLVVSPSKRAGRTVPRGPLDPLDHVPSTGSHLLSNKGLSISSAYCPPDIVPTSSPRMLMSWRRSLGYAWWHADIGADLAAAAGVSERTILYIRTHHQPNGPAAALHSVDEAS